MQKKWLRGPDTLTALSGWCISAQAQLSYSLTLCVWGFSGSCQPPLAAQEKRKSKVHRRFPDATKKSHPTLNYLGVIYKIWHSLFLLHLPLQLFKFISVQIYTSERVVQAGLEWRSSNILYIVFLNKCCLRDTQDRTQESLQQQVLVLLCVSLITGCCCLCILSFIFSHINTRSHRLVYPTPPDRYFLYISRTKKIDKSFVLVLLWREKPSSNTD